MFVARKTGTDGDCIVVRDNTIYINVCGMRYETSRDTLERYPDTLLGNEKKRGLHYRKQQNDYYFDRHRESFEAILYFYQSEGVLIRPLNIPMEVFEAEINFFDLGDDMIRRVRAKEGYAEPETIELPKNKRLRQIWMLFEIPESSAWARLMMLWSALIIILSVVIFCVDSLPSIGYSAHAACYRSNLTNISSSGQTVGHECTYNYIQTLEVVCVAWFTFEYVIRLICAPNKRKFVKGFLNMVDLCAIVPYFIITMIGRNATPLGMIRLLRTARILRVFKLSRYSANLQLMGKTLRESFSELCMLAFFLMFGIIVFSSALFYAEEDANPEVFPSIPETFWYTLVTMTTVGYGDKVPITTFGMMIGAVCACSGVLMVAMVVPVIVTNFERYHKARNEETATQLNKDILAAKRENEFLLNGSTVIG